MSLTPNSKRQREENDDFISTTTRDGNNAPPMRVILETQKNITEESSAPAIKSLAGRKISLMSRNKQPPVEPTQNSSSLAPQSEISHLQTTSHSSRAGAAAAAVAAANQIKHTKEGGKRILSLGKKPQKSEDNCETKKDESSNNFPSEMGENENLVAMPMLEASNSCGNATLHEKNTCMGVIADLEDKNKDIQATSEQVLEDHLQAEDINKSLLKSHEDSATITPNLSTYNLSACNYTVGSKSATPIGFSSMNGKKSNLKHSKLGYAIPQPTTDFGVLAPFFFPSAFEDLNVLVMNSIIGTSNNSNTGGSNMWSPYSASVSCLGLRSGGMLSALSPTVEGTSITSSPAYGIPGSFGPRTPTSDTNGLGVVSHVSPHPTGIMGSPVPLRSGTTTTQANQIVSSNGQPTSHQSPSMHNPTSATTFIPLPKVLEYPMFVRENQSSIGRESEHRISKESNEQQLLASEHLFGTSLLPLTTGYEFDPRNKVGEGTYGAVYIGHSKSSAQQPTRKTVAIKMLKQLPNFEGFPITSVREIGVHRHLYGLPESQRSKLLVADDLRFEYLDTIEGVEQTPLSLEMRRELSEVNSKLPPSLRDLPATRRGMVVNEVVVFLISPFVEHTLSSMRQSLRLHGATSSSATFPTSSATSSSAQLSATFLQGFDHRNANKQPLSPLCMNEEFILFIFIQVLEGLNQLHKARIMHRDIKEDNVLITKNGDVKICDFGLAVPLEGDRAKITPSLIVMFYRPPEMLLGASQYSTSVDMWSAGCLLAQQFLGVPPFITPNGQPSNEMNQLKIIADVLGPLPAKLMDLASPDVRNLIFNHPERDKIFEQGTFLTSTSSNKPLPLTEKQRYDRFSTWFEQMYRARRRTHINSVALEAPSVDTLVAIFNMLKLDPSARPTAERMLKCNERHCSNQFANNAILVEVASSNSTDMSLRSRQVAQSIQQSLCWACKAKSRTAYMKSGVTKLPPPKTHLRSKQQQ